MNKSLIIPQFLLLSSLAGVFTHQKDFVELSERDSRLISFDSDDGKIDIDLDLSIPFISIPLNTKGDDNGAHPLVNINARSIAVASILTLISTIIIPLLFNKSHSHPKYRSEDDFNIWNAGRSFKEFILGNNYVTPCIQRAICESIARAEGSTEATAADKIIEGFSNLKWIKELINGTSIEEAFKVGRHNQCVLYSKKCSMSSDLFDVMINELGIK